MSQKNKTQKRKTYKRKNKRSKRIRKSRRSFIKKTRNKKSRDKKSINKKSRNKKSRKRMVGGIINKKRFKVSRRDKLYYSEGQGGVKYHALAPVEPEVFLEKGDEIITKGQTSILKGGKMYLRVFSYNEIEPRMDLCFDSAHLEPPTYEYNGKRIQSMDEFAQKAELSQEIKDILKREGIELNELEFIDVHTLFKTDEQREEILRVLGNLKPVEQMMTAQAENVLAEGNNELTIEEQIQQKMRTVEMLQALGEKDTSLLHAEIKNLERQLNLTQP